MFKVLRNGLLRYILHTCPKLWCNPCSNCYGMDCFGTYFTHVQSCDVTRVQTCDVTRWTITNETDWQRNQNLNHQRWVWVFGFEKPKNLMFFFRLSVVKSSFPYSETPIFLLESWPCHTKYLCINIRAFQKYHKYHVSGSRTKNYKKKKRGTRKGAVSAGYLVFQGRGQTRC